MSSLVRPKFVCRLSPNEEAAVVHKQREERRRARLLQVRQQEKAFARSVRQEVKFKKEAERRVIQEHLDAALSASHEAELRELESRYLSRMGQMGRGHSDAHHINEEQNRVQELRLLLEAEQRWRAEERHKTAMKELTSNKLVEKETQHHSLKARKKALEVEKERAKQVATSKLHSSQPLIMDLVVGKGHRVQLKEAEGYASTYYHIPNTLVQRVGSPDLSKPNASEMARAKTKEEEVILKHSVVSHQEQLEKARLRHKHALAKVKLEKEKVDVLTQLKTLERQDRAHRQKSLAKIPVNLFQPTHRRGEIVLEQERDMEQAFEKLFTRTHGVHAHPHQALSELASEPINQSSSQEENEPETNQDGEGHSDYNTSSARDSKRMKQLPQSHPHHLHNAPLPGDHDLNAELSYSTDDTSKDAVPSRLPTRAPRSPIFMPRTANARSKKPTSVSPDLYDSSYTSSSIATPTDRTSSSSSEPATSHIVGDTSSLPLRATASAPTSLPPQTHTYPQPGRPVAAVQRGAATHGTSGDGSEYTYQPKYKPSVKFSLVPTVHSPSSSGTPPTTYTPSSSVRQQEPCVPRPPSISGAPPTSHSVQQQEAHVLRPPPLPQPPDLSITGMTTLDTQGSSPSSLMDTSSSTTSSGPMDQPAGPVQAPGYDHSTASVPQHHTQLQDLEGTWRQPDHHHGRGDGMQKLVSMIRTQHQQWNKRLMARSNQLSSQQRAASSSSSFTSSTSSHPLAQVHSAATQQPGLPQTSGRGDTSKTHHHDSLSVYTLSTRDSTVSPEELTLLNGMTTGPATTPHDHEELVPHSSPPHSLDGSLTTSTSSSSPEPLSISPYHTTLDMSTAAMSLSNTNTNAPLAEIEQGNGEVFGQTTLSSHPQESTSQPILTHGSVSTSGGVGMPPHLHPSQPPYSLETVGSQQYHHPPSVSSSLDQSTQPSGLMPGLDHDFSFTTVTHQWQPDEVDGALSTSLPRYPVSETLTGPLHHSPLSSQVTQHSTQSVHSDDTTTPTATTGSSQIHIEDVELLPFTRATLGTNTQPQVALSPIHEEDSEDETLLDPANLPSVTTMPSYSVLELPSHLSVPVSDDKPPNAVSVQPLLRPCDLDVDLTATTAHHDTHSQSPPPPPQANLSHSTPSNSRSPSPLMSAHLSPPLPPMSPVLRSVEEPSPTLHFMQPERDYVRMAPSKSQVSTHVADRSGHFVAQQPRMMETARTREHEQLVPEYSSDHDSNDTQQSDTEELIHVREPNSGKNLQLLAHTSSVNTAASTVHPPKVKEDSAIATAMSSSSITPLSLQEAFLRKKEEFVQRSRARLQQLKSAAEKRQVETTPVYNTSTQRLTVKVRPKTNKPSSTHVNSVSPNHASPNDKRKKAVSFSTPLLQHGDTNQEGSSRQPPLILSSQQREKIRRKEMKERNLRFYNRLPEVKQRRQEEKRQESYTANRENAKQYQQKLRSKYMGKHQDSKKAVKESQDNVAQSKQTRKPPFR